MDRVVLIVIGALRGALPATFSTPPTLLFEEPVVTTITDSQGNTWTKTDPFTWERR